MKKTYNKLEIEVVLFENKDVLTASGGTEPKDKDTIYFNFGDFFGS